MRLAIALMLVGVASAAAAPPGDGAKRDFGLFCATCHGPEGKGNGPAAATLSAKPKDLADCARMKELTDETLFAAIKEGGEAVHLSKDMPAWKGGMGDEEIHALVGYVRSLCE